MGFYNIVLKDTLEIIILLFDTVIILYQSVIARKMYIFVQVLFNTQQRKEVGRERQREEQTGNNKCSEMKPTNSTETSSKLFKDKLVVEVYKNREKKLNSNAEQQ